MPAIELRRVLKRFSGDSVAVRDLDLTIPDGSFTTLLGPSGCGKTTSLRMIAGLEMPTDGSIVIGDQVVFSLEQGRSVPPAKRGIGLVFQSYALWPHLTVRQNIAFGLEVQRVGKTETTTRVEEVASALQIEPYLERYTSELSGGQQQRVAIARVLVMRPGVLLLDEPLSNLDATLRMDMRAELKRLHFETGATVVYVTHDQLEALTMSTHIALMREGVLQQFAPPLELYAHPANRFAADFLGNPRINLVPGLVDDGGIACGTLRVPVAPGTHLDAGRGAPVTVGLRSEELWLEREDGPGRAAARITSVLPTGADWYYRVALGNDAVTVRDDRYTDLREGDEIWLVAKPNPLKAFDADGRSCTAAAGREAPSAPVGHTAELAGEGIDGRPVGGGRAAQEGATS